MPSASGAVIHGGTHSRMVQGRLDLRLRTARWLAILALLLAPVAASAHLMAAQRASINLVGADAFVAVVLPVAALAQADDDHDGWLTQAEVARHAPALRAWLEPRIEVRGDGAADPAQTLALDFTVSPEHDRAPDRARHVIVLKHVRFAAVPGTVTLGLPWLAQLPEETLRVTATRSAAVPGQLAPPDDQAAPAPVQAGAEVQVLHAQHTTARFFRSPLQVLGDMGGTGITHVLGGADHLMFLAPLVVAGAGWRYGVGVITAFTIAHSLTLVLALLGWVRVPEALTESLIAASIVVMALDNLRLARRGVRPRTAPRAALAFAFGLLHGLGFAASLALPELGGPALALHLVGFNLGIEAGQAAFLLGVWALMALAQRVCGLAPRRVATALSLLALAAGSLWLVQRVWDGLA